MKIAAEPTLEPRIEKKNLSELEQNIEPTTNVASLIHQQRKKTTKKAQIWVFYLQIDQRLCEVWKLNLFPACLL